MTVADLTDFLDETGLPITLGAHRYLIPSPDGEKGLKMAAMAQVGMKAKLGGDITEGQLKSLKMDDGEERDFIRFVCTDEIVDAMLADGINWTAMSRVAQYAFTHFAIGEETARKALEAGLFSGKASAPTGNRAARRTAAKSPKSPASPGSSRPKPPKTSGSRSSALGR